MKKNVRTTHLVLLFIGIALIAVGGILALFWPSIFKIFLLTKELKLTANSNSFAEWKKPSVPLYFDVYFWNWTNSEKIEDHSVKPSFTQLGPYRFREIRDKQDIKFNNRDSTVSYNPISSYYFDAEGSNGTLDDIVLNVNLVAIGAVGQTTRMTYKQKKIVSMGLNAYEEHFVVAKTARELLFEGYEDDMVSAGREGIVQGFDPNDIPFDRIGWFYKRNASTELTGSYVVNTGSKDISKLGLIEKFDGKESHDLYSGECSKLKGSTGELFHPDLTPDSISIFMGDLCRSIPFDYEEDVQVHGITGHRFVAGDRAIDNGTKYPENLCYSAESEDSFPSGVMNISACRYSSPIFMSYPHFFNADDYYLNNVDGLNPIKDRHQSYFTLEPMTGAPLEVVIRFQANFLLREVEDISLFQLFPTIFIPAMWFEQKFTMNSEMAEQIKFALQVPVMGRVVGIEVFCFGVILVIVSSVIRCLGNRQSRDNSADVNLNEANVGSRRQFEKGAPLITAQGKKISIKKMDVTN